MREKIEILRLGIDGRWAAEEMGRSLLHIQDLYNLRLIIQVIYEDWRDLERLYDELMHFPSFRRGKRRRLIYPALFSNPYQIPPAIPLVSQDLIRISNFLYPQEKLEVQRIQYGSEGFKDLAGIGEIVGHIKDFILKLIEHKSAKRQRELENEEKEIRNQQLRIENARSFVALAKECGYSEPEIRSLVHFVDDRQQTLVDLIDTDKIRSVRLLNDNERKNQ